MYQHTKRRLAIGAARSEMRRVGLDQGDMSAEQALMVLDDLTRTEPYLEASIWYRNASENQIVLFKREWRYWCCGFGAK